MCRGLEIWEHPGSRKRVTGGRVLHRSLDGKDLPSGESIPVQTRVGENNKFSPWKPGPVTERETGNLHVECTDLPRGIYRAYPV